jgi:hypothetical protein
MEETKMAPVYRIDWANVLEKLNTGQIKAEMDMSAIEKVVPLRRK